MKNLYRKASKGEITCSECAFSYLPAYGRLRCSFDAFVCAVGKNHTCRYACKRVEVRG